MEPAQKESAFCRGGGEGKNAFQLATWIPVPTDTIGPPKGIEVRDFNRFLSIFNHFSIKLIENIEFYMEIKPE